MKQKVTVPGTKASDKKRGTAKAKPADNGLFVEIDLGGAGFDPATLFSKDAGAAVGSYVYHPEIVAPHRQRDPYQVMRRGKRPSALRRLQRVGGALLSLPVGMVQGIADTLASRRSMAKPKRSMPVVSSRPGKAAWLMPAGAVACVAGLTTVLWLGVAPKADPVVSQILGQNGETKRQLAIKLATEPGLVTAARSRIVAYTVKAGDTMSALAVRFHLNEQTIRQANNLSDRPLAPGKALTILPLNGVLHTIDKGETALELAFRYGLPLAKIQEANHDVRLDQLQVGQSLIIPGAAHLKERPAPPRRRERVLPIRLASAEGRVTRRVAETRTAPAQTDRSSRRERQRPVSRSLSAGGRFLTPAAGYQSSPYGWRWGSFHSGIDIAGTPGTTIRSSRDGVVVSAGWDGAYGQSIVISHGGGVTTRYGHCSRLLVSPGQRVEVGQPIGAMGSTGRATGPHVHFEVMVNGTHVNPHSYL